MPKAARCSVAGCLPVISAEEVARAGYRGLKAGRRVVIPGAMNKINAISARLLPRRLMLPIASAMISRRTA
jgi:short-subunit dehydrogenase